MDSQVQNLAGLDKLTKLKPLQMDVPASMTLAGETNDEKAPNQIDDSCFKE